jgi:hypothetical protein
MLKKLMTFSMIFCLTIVQAHASTNNGLKAAFDDMNYALTVEWDQTDRTFYNSQIELFRSKIAELQKDGLSNQELISFTLSHVKDANAAKDLETAFNLIAINKMAAHEAQRFVTDVMNKSYNRGASWGGEVIIGAIVLVLVIAVVAIVAGKARVDNGCYEVWTCDQYCSANVCYEDCSYRCVN